MRQVKTAKVQLEEIVSSGASIQGVPDIEKIINRALRSYNDMILKQHKKGVNLKLDTIKRPGEVAKSIRGIQDLQTLINTINKGYVRRPQEKVSKLSELESYIKSTIPNAYYTEIKPLIKRYEKVVEKYNKLPESDKLYNYDNIIQKYSTTLGNSPIKMINDLERLERIIANPAKVKIGSYDLYEEELKELKKRNLNYNKELRKKMIEDIKKYYVDVGDFDRFDFDTIKEMYKEAAKRYPKLYNKPHNKKPIKDEDIERMINFLMVDEYSPEDLQAFVSTASITGQNNEINVRVLNHDLYLKIYEENYIRGLYNVFGNIRGSKTKINEIYKIMRRLTTKYGIDILDDRSFDYGDMEDWYKMQFGSNEEKLSVLDDIYTAFKNYELNVIQNTNRTKAKEEEALKRVLSDEELYG